MDSKLNSELLRATAPEEKKQEPKRNSKGELIDKIIQLAEQNSITLELSDTALKRMTKQQLNEKLAEVIELAMRNEMARQVGARPGAADAVIALGALRMVHDIAAKGVERAANSVLPAYGYEIDGFYDSLQDPSVREATDACLAEIAQDSDILQYVQSPWARLSIAWGGALVTSIQRKKKRAIGQRFYAPSMESRQFAQQNTRHQSGPRGRAPDGKVDRDGGASVEVV